MISDCHNTDCDKLINVISLPKSVLFYLCIIGEIGDPRTDGNHSADAVQGKMYRHTSIYTINMMMAMSMEYKAMQF